MKTSKEAQVYQPNPAPGQTEMDALLEDFAPMIRMIAQRLVFRLPSSLDIDDLIHSGVIGLMNALDRYDPKINTRFKTYAEFRIRGAMLDEIRTQDWVPRSVHDKSKKLRKASDDFIKKAGRPPTEEELVAALEMDQETFDEFLYQARGVTLLSLDDLGVKEGVEWRLIEAMADPNGEDPLLSVLSLDEKNHLIQAIEALSKKEQIVVSLYYHEELTLKEIGAVLSVSESRICQLHSKAIMKLKGILSQ
ncbi:RNA polymerase sigma factor for flagellar operon [hydrothermal vent metagenome]|uniref:RNA polymerase sigma factor for flagellar operon n=1 Tax=hydrothermal vent metagenome TaxID=652676 RepID=A0A3B1CVB8_9ZZZZ|nr:FliA/WhiG family RNA polymerase sigma factor [Candidatus Manganitrophaceae bacterium]